MRRIASVVLMCFCLTSCAFSRTVETDEAGIRAHYEDLEELQLQVEVAAEFPDRVSEYLLKYHYRRNADSTIQVLQPESIAGVAVTVRDRETRLAVDGLELETGTLDENGLSPISALPKLMYAWQSHPTEIESMREDGQDLLLLIYEEDEVSYRTVFSRETYAPIRGEIFSEGKCVLRLRYVT